MRARSFSLAVVPFMIVALALGGCSKQDRRAIERQVSGDDNGHHRGDGDHGRRHENGGGHEGRREHHREGGGEGGRERGPEQNQQSNQQSQQQANNQSSQQSGAHTPAPATTPAPSAMNTGGELPLLYDQIEKPAYKPAYAALLATMDRVPKWVSRGGTASPGRVVKIGNAEYESYSHCKPRDCGDNMMYVLFSRDLKHAWALLVKNGNAKYFGDPNADQTAFLKQQACHDSALTNC